MLGCNEVITLLKKCYDAEKRQEVLEQHCQFIGSWFREEKSSISDKHVVAGDLVKVRIPIMTCCCMPKIEKGDVLIHGTVYDLTGKSIGEIRKEYPDSMEVQSVTYNTDCNAYSRHVRCGGS